MKYLLIAAVVALMVMSWALVRRNDPATVTWYQTGTKSDTAPNQPNPDAVALAKCEEHKANAKRIRANLMMDTVSAVTEGIPKFKEIDDELNEAAKFCDVNTEKADNNEELLMYQQILNNFASNVHKKVIEPYEKGGEKFSRAVDNRRNKKQF